MLQWIMEQIISLISDLRYFWMHPYVIKDETEEKESNICAKSHSAALAQIRLSFEEAHPYILEENIPKDMITPAGCIIDPKITVEAAKSQIQRIANARGVDKSVLDNLVNDNKIECSEKSLVDVIQLNIKLDEI